MSAKKKILILAGVMLMAFLVLDFYFLAGNVYFLFRGYKNVYQDSPLLLPAHETMAPDKLIIENLGIEAPVVYVSQQSEKAYQAGLATGVVHFPATANPGQFGNCYIFGHSSDYIWSKGLYKSVFAVLPSIEKGVEIIISDQAGNKFRYTVIDSHKIAANDFSVLDQGDYTKKLLTLQTSYPVGTALARWVVVGEIK